MGIISPLFLRGKLPHGFRDCPGPYSSVPESHSGLHLPGPTAWLCPPLPVAVTVQPKAVLVGETWLSRHSQRKALVPLGQGGLCDPSGRVGPRLMGCKWVDEVERREKVGRSV